MNPHYDVIVDGLLKRLDERGNTTEDLEYVLARIMSESSAAIGYTVIKGETK